jgi:hypothetical protein
VKSGKEEAKMAKSESGNGRNNRKRIIGENDNHEKRRKAKEKKNGEKKNRNRHRESSAMAARASRGTPRCAQARCSPAHARMALRCASNGVMANERKISAA